MIVNGNVEVQSQLFYAIGSVGLALYLLVGLLGFFAGYWRSLGWAYLYLYGLLFLVLWLGFYVVATELLVNCEYSDYSDCYAIGRWPRALFYINAAANFLILLGFIICAANFIALLTHYQRVNLQRRPLKDDQLSQPMLSSGK